MDLLNIFGLSPHLGEAIYIGEVSFTHKKKI